jgi:flavin-dependent dehydrogenase
MLLPRLRASARGGQAELHGRLLELLPGVEAERLVSHHLPLSTWRPAPAHGRALLVGDALSLINPLTGEGIYYALLSGRLAGAAAVGAAPAGPAYSAALRRALGRHLRHTTLLARLTARPGVVDAGVSACGRSPAAFDALVELGLGQGLITRPWSPGITGELGRRALGRRVAA